MQKNNNYWTYLIDNFERDLAGITWWINETNFHKGNKVCLLPTKELSAKYLFNERPDVIVWNYARNNNIEFIKIANYLNIFNIIHDTEGIPYNMSNYFNINQKGFEYIDEIWCWGKIQKETLEKKIYKLKIKPKILAMGSIRYEYIKSLKKNDFTKNINKVLWNTNYPLLSPRYQTVFREYKELYKLNKYYTEEESFYLFLKLASRRQKAYEFIKRIFTDQKKINLTIRPHPFESSKFYRESLLYKYKKVKISEGCDVNDDLENTSLVIQNGCQTVLDSFIRGTPSIRTSTEEINIWSKLTPYIESRKLEANINNINFLNRIYSKQKKLFKINKVNLLLNNLSNKIKISNSPKIRESKFQLGFNKIVFLIYIRLKILAKEILIKDSIDSKKKKKINTLDIVNFIKKKYKLNTLSRKNFCLIYPK